MTKTEGWIVSRGAAVDELRKVVATACRVLAHSRLAQGVLGHVSARVGPDECVVRCRGPQERGLAYTTPADVRLVTLDGDSSDLPEGYSPPNELPIHTRVLRRRPDVGAVVHAHPWAALMCGLADVELRPVFGAFNIPAMRMAVDGVPVFPRPVLISRDEVADEMVDAMGASDVCVLRGHGITVVGESVEQATVRALNLTILCQVSLELTRLGARPSEVTKEDLAELPDLGTSFNYLLNWEAAVAALDGGDACRTCG